MKEYETAIDYGKLFISKVSECDETGCKEKSSNTLLNLFLSGISLTHMQYESLKTLLILTQQDLGQNLDIHEVCRQFNEIDYIYEL